jgi:hypothetical protein
VTDEASPVGVHIHGAGGPGQATLQACSDPIAIYLVDSGDDFVVTCGSAITRVIAGPVEARFGSLDAVFGAGVNVTVSQPLPGTFAVTNSAASSSAVLVGGLTVAPGGTASSIGDSDSDGLADVVETNTGIFNGPADTGTDPNDPDKDNDGLTDGSEIIIHGTSAFVVDTDGDGCKEAREVGMNQSLGGRRDPLNPWDYFNPEKIYTPYTQTVADILRVVNQYNKNMGNPLYTAETDRTGIPNAYPWSLGPPNGTQTVEDILAAVKQFGHNCAAT